MNHKRGKPRNARAGCKHCKRWKINGYPTEKEGGERWSDHKRRTFAKKDWIVSTGDENFKVKYRKIPKLTIDNE